MSMTELQSGTRVALLRMPEVLRRTGWSRSSLLRLIARGEFPSSCSLGSRAVAWEEAAVETYIRARIGAPSKARVKI